MTTFTQNSVRDTWQLEMADSYTSPSQLGEALGLPENWVKQHENARKLFSMRVPKHFASLMQPGDIRDPLLLQVMPLASEFEEQPGFTDDPLQEQKSDAPTGLLHKYKSRVLILLKGGCAVNCRYCFRRHFPYQEHSISERELQAILTYIQEHPEVNEVILSGGDPLMARDQHLEKLLDTLENIPGLKRLRIHSRLPVVIPSRLTQHLANRLERSSLQALLVLHVNHPNEVSEPLKKRLDYWKKAGVTLLNQSVLLKNVNDDPDTLIRLSEALFDANVLPYYLHQLDKVKGATHFSVSDSKGIALVNAMLRELPGFLVPRFVREVSGELSKTPIDLTID